MLKLNTNKFGSLIPFSIKSKKILPKALNSKIKSLFLQKKQNNPYNFLKLYRVFFLFNLIQETFTA